MHTTTATRTLAALLAAFMAVCLAFCLAPAQAQAADSTLTVSQPQTTDGGQTTAKAEPRYAGLTLTVRAKVQGGWKKTVAAGKVAGTKSSKGLRALKVTLKNKGDLTGSVKYLTYAKGKGNSKTAANGKATKSLGTNVQAVRIWLTGNVSKHYDILYRSYVKGKGWQPWVKNKKKSGITKKGFYISAVKVKLSPKTEEAAGRTASRIGLRYEASLVDSGWQSWTGDGKTAGKQDKKKAIDRFVLKADAGNSSGSVTYAAYTQGKKWRAGWVKSGAAIGTQSKQIEAFRFKLTGAIASNYDIYYRTYVGKYKWLDWAKNGAVSGGPGSNVAVSAIQVKLVKKGSAAPGATAETTVASKKKTLDGVDIASYQGDGGINIPKIVADFVIVKATGGTSYTNPYYRAHANAVLKSGKLLGLYHYACEYGKVNSANAEADYFVKAAGPYIGKAVLVLDWEADALLLGSGWAKKFMDRVYKKTGVRPLIYMSQSVALNGTWSNVAKTYKLWVAEYPDYSRTGYQSKPWTNGKGWGPWSKPTIFQYSSTGRISGYKHDIDLDLFYGRASDWNKLASKV